MGSEMCIRDRSNTWHLVCGRVPYFGALLLSLVSVLLVAGVRKLPPLQSSSIASGMYVLARKTTPTSVLVRGRRGDKTRGHARQPVSVVHNDALDRS